QARAAGVKETARADSPADGGEVVARGPEGGRSRLLPSAESAHEELSAYGWYQRSVYISLLGLRGRPHQGLRFSDLRTCGEGLLNQDLQRIGDVGKGDGRELRVVGEQVEGGVQPEDLGKACRLDPSLLGGLLKDQLVALGLDLHAQLVALEGDS